MASDTIQTDNTPDETLPRVDVTGANLPPDITPLARNIDAYDAVAAFNLGMSLDTKATLMKSESLCRVTAAVLSIYSKIYDHNSPLHNSLWQLWGKAGDDYYSPKRRKDVKGMMMSQLSIVRPVSTPNADDDARVTEQALFTRRDKLLDRGIDFAGAIMLSHPDYLKRDTAMYSVDQAFDFFDQAKGIFILPYQCYIPAFKEDNYKSAWFPEGDFLAMIEGNRTLGIEASPHLRLPIDNRILRIRLLQLDDDGRAIIPTKGQARRETIYASGKQIEEASISKRVNLKSAPVTLPTGQVVVKTEATPMAITAQRTPSTPVATSSTSTASKSATPATAAMTAAQIAGKPLPIFVEALTNARKALNSFFANGALERPLTQWPQEELDLVDTIDNEFQMLDDLLAQFSEYVRHSEDEETALPKSKPARKSARK